MNLHSSPMDTATLRLMVYHPIRAIWFYLLAAAVLAALAGYAWQHRRTSAARYWAIGLAIRSVFLSALVMVTVSPALPDKVFWAKIQQVSALAMIPTFFLLAVNVAEQKGRVIRRLLLALVMLTVLSILALLSTGWHGLFWRGVVWDGSTFGIIRGPLYWISTSIGYCQFLLVVVLCVIWARKASGLRRWQIAALPADPLISLAGHLAWAIDQRAGVIPPLPLAFMLSGIAYSWVFFRLRVLDLAQLAQTAVTRNMNDSLIIVDDQDYVVELNPAAQRLFGERTPGLVGSRSVTAFTPWPALAELAASSEARTGELSLKGGNYLFRVTPLAGWGNTSIGKAIVLQDIGELKEAQAKILDQQKALSIMAERERLGRELHDGRGQVWNYLSLKLQTVRSFLKGGQVEKGVQQVDRLIGTIKEMNADARESIFGLKTPAGGEGFVDNLQDYLDWYEEANGIAVELVLPDDAVADLLSHTGKVQLLRIIQEALTNIRKHARARQVKVRVEKADRRIIVQVEDDGCGFDPAAAPTAKNSFGLRIMAERAEEAGGRLRVESAPGQGTKVTVEFDLDEVADSENTVG